MPTRSVEYVGWIFRRHQQNYDAQSYNSLRPSILISCAGGGKGTASSVLPQINECISQFRQCYKLNFLVRQVIGPRSNNQVISTVDECIKACPTLHLQFSSADLVITTAGYNSTLELANTSVPVLFTPVKRTFDDQFARARRWAPSMGKLFLPQHKDSLQQWIRTILLNRYKRSPVELGPSGAGRCAQLIVDECV